MRAALSNTSARDFEPGAGKDASVCGKPLDLEGA